MIDPLKYEDCEWCLKKLGGVYAFRAGKKIENGVEMLVDITAHSIKELKEKINEINI
jgi:hypothetical protein